MEKLCKFDQGMVLLAGVTGSGKSTTIASMLDWINHNYRKHILTLEDPIEFVFTEDKCLINQREIGMDVKDFEIGMKHAVREDPDVMLVGEMRDRETFMTAIHAAETGHLVFGTIHASTAPSTIGRILDLFPEGQRSAVRSAMAFNMKAIVAQKLLPSIKPGVGRVPTVEIMTFNPTVRKLILEEQDEKLADAIRIGKEEGMQDFTMSLKKLDRRRADRPPDGLRSGAEPRSPEDGAEGNRGPRSGDIVTCRSKNARVRFDPVAAAASPGCGREDRARGRRIFAGTRATCGDGSWRTLPVAAGGRLYYLSWMKIAAMWVVFVVWAGRGRLGQSRPGGKQPEMADVEPDRRRQLFGRDAADVDHSLVLAEHLSAARRRGRAGGDLRRPSATANCPAISTCSRGPTCGTGSPNG